MRKKCDAGSRRPLRIRGAEDRTEIAQPGSGKQRIAERMRGRISIRVTGKTSLAWPMQPGHPHRTTFFECMDVSADTGKHSVRRTS
jgi:hypothetical protein